LPIHLTRLTKTYRAGSAEVPVLRGIDLTIADGERVALLGKSGSGKSTLLNLLGGLDRPTEGSIEIDGRDLARFTGDELARHRLTTVGMIFQAFHLVPSRTAVENVELPLVFAGVRRKDRVELARKTLEEVGLGHRLDHRPSELSGGERQRVAVARALVNRPKVVLADEPTGNLDSATGREIVELLTRHLDAHSSTLLLVTHDEELARRCATRVLRMTDGRIDG
jgi:predicted ABC-type transport system involved in lysophospholipase L1 biosynthesis ATPase subunit